ncbi:MAG: hypothetical protein ACKOVB_24125, partial [Terrabacter sp.]
RNSLWSITDLAVTVRGSVSAEFPAYGIPALQAGWSEWSHLGFSRRADSPDDYCSALEACVRDLVAGVALITPEQVRRARLWLWFYRSGADVTTPLVPHWEVGQGEALHQLVTTSMNHVEDDADPAYVSMRRLWERRDPVLTRMDLGLDSSALAASHALLSSDAPFGAVGLDTAHDELAPHSDASRISSGQSPHLRMVEGFVRGSAIVGRASQAEAVLVLDTGPPAVGRQVTLELALDAESSVWWGKRSSPTFRHLDATRMGRRIQVGFAGGSWIDVDLSPAGVQPGRPITTSMVTVPIPADSSRLANVVIRSCPDRRGGTIPQSAIGVRVNWMAIRTDAIAPSRRPS